MKKAFIIVVLILAIVMSMFTGCAGKEAEPLRICVDLGYVCGGNASLSADFYEVPSALKSSGILTDFEVEYIPSDGAERETALNHIRTEIMSGGGPDVFIMNCIKSDGTYISEDALFPMPEKTMEAGLFLPLDEYIENYTQYAEWDKFTQSVMDAGKNEEGQQIIPLIYTLPAAVYRASDVYHIPSENISWNDVVEDEVLYAATAAVADGFNKDYSMLNDAGNLIADFHMNYVLGDLADFQEEELLFTEEELLQRVIEVEQMQAFSEQENIYGAPDWYEGYLGLEFDRCSYPTKNGIYPEDELTIIPIYSDDGGCTATITSFAAVNRNTQYPEDAFAVIDRLLSTSMMQHSALYVNYLYGAYSGIPMHEDIFSGEYPVLRRMNGCLTNENFAAFSKVRDQIVHTEFADTLHAELEDMMIRIDRASSDEERENIVHAAYETMKQMIAE